MNLYKKINRYNKKYILYIKIVIYINFYKIETILTFLSKRSIISDGCSKTMLFYKNERKIYNEKII